MDHTFSDRYLWTFLRVLFLLDRRKHVVTQNQLRVFCLWYQISDFWWEMLLLGVSAAGSLDASLSVFILDLDGCPASSERSRPPLPLPRGAGRAILMEEVVGGIQTRTRWRERWVKV